MVIKPTENEPDTEQSSFLAADFQSIGGDDGIIIVILWLAATSHARRRVALRTVSDGEVSRDPDRSVIIWTVISWTLLWIDPRFESRSEVLEWDFVLARSTAQVEHRIDVLCLTNKACMV